MKNWLRKFERFFQHSFSEKLLFIKVLAFIILIHFLLKILRFSSFRQLFSTFFSKETIFTYSPQYVNQIVKFTKISASIFSIVCLPQALTVLFFLRKDRSFFLKIGVNLESDFKAHAWVEKDTQFIIGDTPSIKYDSLWQWADS